MKDIAFACIAISFVLIVQVQLWEPELIVAKIQM